MFELLLGALKLFFIETRSRVRRMLMGYIVDERLEKYGVAPLGKLISDEQCKRLRLKIDNFIHESPELIWSDAMGSDQRIYFAEYHFPELKKMMTDEIVASASSSVTGACSPKVMFMLSRVSFVPGNEGSGGGWHRDSPFSRQVKMFCYLSEVAVAHGPFQYIGGSHCYKDMIKVWCSGFPVSRFRYSAEEVTDRFADIDTVVAEPGLVFIVNTRGVHRGAPIEIGRRYSLFVYMWDKKIPAQFLELKEKYVLVD